MARVKGGISTKKRKKNVLQHTKGFRWGRKKKYRAAKDAMIHAWQYAFRDRKTKKRNFRQLWNTQIGAALEPHGITYSRFIGQLKKHNIALDRKVLATLAKTNPEVFNDVVIKAKT
jgi:large subunit ribosomal protein L20